MHYRSIWLSDLHLGTKGANPERVKAFLVQNTCDTLYLVGDIIDFWALSRKPYFPLPHLDLLRKFLNLSKKTRVVFIAGNHDEHLRQFTPMVFGNLEIVNEAEHVGVDGKRYLVTHGDAYDQIIKYAKWLAWLGDIGYTLLLRSNHYVNVIRRLLRRPGKWSLSAYVKQKVKSAASFITDYEHAVCEDVRRRGLDGVICGHIHKAEIRDVDGVLYINDGDGVESCTAVVESLSGVFEIVEY